MSSGPLLSQLHRGTRPHTANQPFPSNIHNRGTPHTRLFPPHTPAALVVTSRSRTTRHLNFSSRESPFLSESHPPPSSCQCQLLCLVQAGCLTNPGQTLTHPGQTTLINIRHFPGTSSYFISHPFYFLSSSFFQRHVCSPSKLLQLCFSFISS